MYFVIADLAHINPMYQFSLTYFQRLFHKSLVAAEARSELAERLTVLSDTIVRNTFVNVCRGLFEEHKLIFSLMFAYAQQRADGIVSPAEWSLLLRGVPLMDMSAKPPNPDSDFFPEKQWSGGKYSVRVKGLQLCTHVW